MSILNSFFFIKKFFNKFVAFNDYVLIAPHQHMDILFKKLLESENQIKLNQDNKLSRARLITIIQLSQSVIKIQMCINSFEEPTYISYKILLGFQKICTHGLTVYGNCTVVYFRRTCSK